MQSQCLHLDIIASRMGMHHAMSRLYITCARIASDTSVWCIIEMDFMQNWLPDRQTDRQSDPRVCIEHGLEAHIDAAALCTWTSKRLLDPLVRTKRRVFDRNRILFVCLNVNRMANAAVCRLRESRASQGHFKRFFGIIIFQFVIFKSGAGGCAFCVPVFSCILPSPEIEMLSCQIYVFRCLYEMRTNRLHGK